MTFKGEATAVGKVANKQYFWKSTYLGNGIQEWCYVTADPLASVDGSNYITDPLFIPLLNVGDIVRVWVADAIDDTRNIQQDLAAGVADYGIHLVLENTGTVVDLSEDLLGGLGGTTAGVVTYGD
jgi:hypothetical protein